MELSGKIVDVRNKRIYPGRLFIEEGIIKKIHPEKNVPDRYILPGFVDAHVHIESSMLTPVAFGKLAVRHGTTAVVADPHEIANVLGMEGIRYMTEQGKKSVIKIKYGIPSCVPATSFETSGAEISAKEIETLFRESEDYHLAEMMNFPGVIEKVPEVMKKIEVAKKYHRIIDGHAPGLMGEALKKYVEAGIMTDHECSTLEEAREKIALGMYILIREGSAAKNLEALMPLLDEAPDKVMFCTDDAHPDDLSERHIRHSVLRCLEKGYDFWHVLRAASINPVEFYGLKMGLLQENDPADFVVCDDLKELKIQEVYINGEKVFDGTNVLVDTPGSPVINRFEAEKIDPADLSISYREGKNLRVIGATDGSLFTNKLIMEPSVESFSSLNRSSSDSRSEMYQDNRNEVKDKLATLQAVPDIKRDLLKIVVLNRYTKKAHPVVGFIHGFGLKEGALASSIAHDSHNLIAVGTNDGEIVTAMNAVIEVKGGIAVTSKGHTDVLPLPVAGLMTTEDGEKVAEKYRQLNRLVQEAGSPLQAPFMTLSFMALLVIPELKIGDRGLFDVNKFDFTELWV